MAQISAVVTQLFLNESPFYRSKSDEILSLAIWCGIVIYAYAFFRTTYQAWIMGAFIGMVLGSAQALSRSLYSQMIPAGRESSFFGLYEISEKGTSWMGQLLFTIIVGATGCFPSRDFSFIVFFVVGSLAFYFTRHDQEPSRSGYAKPEEERQSKVRFCFPPSREDYN